MPQFDTFIYPSNLIYFVIFFLLLLVINITRFLPRLSAILKLRYKILIKSVKTDSIIIPSHDTTCIFGKSLFIKKKN